MTEDATKRERGDVLGLTAEIVSAYVGNNSIAQSTVADLIQTTFEKLNALAKGEDGTPIELTPAVPIKKSITNDYLVCLEDGKRLKMLKRHLMSNYGMTPQDYRTKWGLKADYPMVAPAYAQMRHDLAVRNGLGRKREEPVIVKSRAKRGARPTAKQQAPSAKPSAKRKPG